MLYLDTSLLVAAFTYEAATGRALALLRGSRREPLLVSEWVNTEFAAAMSVKIRTKEIDDTYHAEAIALFAKSVADSMDVAVVTTAHFKEAAKFAGEHRLGLRAGDALHLAIAGDKGAILCTLDKRLAAAGKALGVAARLI
jgi:predicted nucleic acid-binding protein